MKSLFFPVVALLALTLAVRAQVPVGPGSVKIGKITPNLVKTPEFQISGGASKRYKIGEWLEMEVEFETSPENIDDLTFKYTALVGGKLLDGEVTHVTIPKGRDHYSVMYVAPRTLERLAGGKTPGPNIAENVWVEISRQGQVLAKGAAQQKAMPNLPHVAGLILNKNETPFAPLYYDRYEAIKAGR